MADVLGLPLAGELPLDPALAAALDTGAPPGAGARDPLGRFCGEFWERALAGERAS